MSMQYICQSCGMPIEHLEDFGTNSNGIRNREYCNYCFENGKFNDPNLTIDDMIKINLDGLDHNPNIGYLKRFVLKKMYPKNLAKMKRWQHN
ncbi:zinc ribbon domain-containing protein [Weissella koreensis]|uniref:Putative zinc ribbon domain-containing protein n=1 Tax=Weissella koreensis TaxID=165096 RepID=A0A7H1MMA6_9LACO|nr:zinc ribbon domain-containing protein [Weissella koreensis]AVH75387.1 hypothetical protein C4597_04945 [Weissella koreensis]EJF34364.1 hypothetical protein JC2156_12040 [Weissella koreensis KCTC 3621]MCZ9311239.1 zinc ribbon domain-containing protein [Weissella koreensis]QGN20613.1 hypothetical protein GKC51_04930 [Weissella koreensis]QNT64592.1 hypothetical protein FY536_04660 [Weissella koreensis]